LAAITQRRVGAQARDRVVAIISGGNIDLNRLADIAAEKADRLVD
jgi:threonine dehydratase